MKYKKYLRTIVHCDWFFLLLYMAVLLIVAPFLPSFDLDEALYRRIVQEMKLTGNYLIPTWDGLPFYDKPPVLYWAILLVSYVIDTHTEVSILAARIPSIIMSFITIGVCIKWAERRFQNSRESIVLWWTAFLFPCVSASLILYDPMFCTFTTISLLTLVDALENPSHKKSFYILAGSMAMAVIVKGLVGLILPGICLVLYLIGAKDRLKIIRNFFPAFVIATLIAGIFYGALTFLGAGDLVHHFLVVEHFGRGMKARENHSGNIFYYIGVIIVGASVGGSVLLEKWKSIISSNNNSYRKATHLPVQVLVFWVLGTVAFFSCMATKLPNYIWPIWPAIAMLGFYSSKNIVPWSSEKSKYTRGVIALLTSVQWLIATVYSVIVLVLIAVVSFYDQVISRVLAKMPDEDAKAIVLSLANPSLTFKTGLIAMALCFFYLVVLMIKKEKSLPSILKKTTVTHLSFICVVGFLVMGEVRTIFDHSFNSLRKKIEEVEALTPTSKIGLMGITSPSLSLALAPATISRISPYDISMNANSLKVIIMPHRLASLCIEETDRRYIEGGILGLCVKK